MNKRFFAILFTIIFISGSCSLNKMVARKNKTSDKKGPYDLVVIPGYPYEASSNKELFAIRLHWAKAVYDRGIAKNIMFSGDAVHTPYIEGKLMKLFAIEMGIPAEHIYEENKALHTTENIKNAKKLAKEMGFDKIAFATDPYQFSYMVPLVNVLAAGTPLISFPTDSMEFYSQPLPENVNINAAFVENWSDPTKK